MHVEPEYGVLSRSFYRIYPVNKMCSAGESEGTPSLRSYRPGGMDLVDACVGPFHTGLHHACNGMLFPWKYVT